MLALGGRFRYYIHMDIPRQIPTSQLVDVTYCPTTRECTFIPAHLRSLEKFQEIIGRLDQSMGVLSDPSSGAPLTTYQFLAAWTRFKPAERNSSYFALSGDAGGWYMDKELLVAVQTALEMLQAVITDALAIVGGQSHNFIIDRDSEQMEKLWIAKELKELRSADKLLKLRVELAFLRLCKLERLHRGESLPTSRTAPERLLPPLPELLAHLHKAWNDPYLPAEDIARRTTAEQRRALEADDAQSEPFVRATNVAHANAEEIPSGNLPPLRVREDVERVALFPTPSYPKQSVSLSNSRGACGDTLQCLVNNSMVLPYFATILCSYESPRFQLSIDISCDNAGGILRARWLHDPGGPHPLTSFQNRNDLLRSWARQKANVFSFQVVPFRRRLDEYCRPSGHILPDLPQLHSLAHIPMEYSTSAPVLRRERSPRSQLPVDGSYGTIEPILQAWKPHDLGGSGSQVPLCLKSFWDLNISLRYGILQNASDPSYPNVPFIGRSNKYCVPSGSILVDLSQFHFPVHISLEYWAIAPATRRECSSRLRHHIDGFSATIEPILQAWRLHDPGGSGICASLCPKSFCDLNISHRYWARQKIIEYGYSAGYFTRQSDEYCGLSDHNPAGPLQFHLCTPPSMEYHSIVFGRLPEWGPISQLSIGCHFRMIRQVLQARQLHDPGGLVGIGVPLRLGSFWDLDISLHYWACRNATDYSYLVVLFTGRSDEFYVPSGRILVDPPQLHPSTHSFIEYRLIVSNMHLEWSTGSPLSVEGFCGTIRQVSRAQRLHDPGGPGPLFPFASVRPQISFVRLYCVGRRTPLTVALRRVQFRNDRRRSAGATVTSLTETCKPFVSLASLWKQSGSPHSCARRNASIHSSLTSPITSSSDMYSWEGTQISPHDLCLYQNRYILAKSCRIWVILVSTASIICGCCRLCRSMVSTQLLGSSATSSPPLHDVHIFTLVLHEYLMDRFVSMSSVQIQVTAFQRF
jgi:hypothetical protein